MKKRLTNNRIDFNGKVVNIGIDVHKISWRVTALVEGVVVRDECLNEHWFVSLQDARLIIEEWRQDYNSNRPHSSLDNHTPNEFVMTITSSEISLEFQMDSH